MGPRLLALLMLLAAAGGIAVLAAWDRGDAGAGGGPLPGPGGGLDRRSTDPPRVRPDPLGDRAARQESLGPLPAPPPAARVDLTRPSALVLDLKRPPKAGLAFDLADGRVLWRHGATRRLPIASITKLMTALLAVERLRPRDLVRVPRAADRVGGSRIGLRPGRHVRAEALLKGLLIASGNDAAVALAVAAAGSVPAFVELMNRRAQRLGLACTRFVDPHGLDPRDRSCPSDVAALAAHAMAEERIARIARRRFARVWPGGGRKLTLRTTNPLVRARYPGAVGLKTGYTARAGRCLVAVVQRGARRIAIVLLGDADPGADARRIVRAATRAAELPPP